MSYFKRFCTFYTSKLFQLLPKNWIVILGGENWLIPYIVLNKITEFLKWDKYPEKKVRQTDSQGDREKRGREERGRGKETAYLIWHALHRDPL